MRRLTFLVLILGTIYSGYWFFGANAVRNGAITAIEDARRDGWDIRYADLATIGFPSRFDTTLSDVRVTPPDGLWAWQAPFLQVFALSYQPNKIIAAFPPDQVLRIGDQTVQINTDGLRTSGGVKANTDLSFDAATAEVGTATVQSDFGWAVDLGRALLALRATPEKDANYDVYFDADDIVLPAAFIGQIDPENRFTDTVSRVALDSTVTLDQPLDRHTRDPAIRSILLKTLAIDWGSVALTAEGELDVDAAGIPTGRITFVTGQWRDIINLLVNTGVIQPGIAPTITNMADAMAQGGVLELPVSFQNGFMSVGPIPLGAAPRLR